MIAMVMAGHGVEDVMMWKWNGWSDAKPSSFFHVESAEVLKSLLAGNLHIYGLRR